MADIAAIDLQAQYQSIRAEIDEAMDRVITRGIFILGEEVKAFEHEFASHCGASFAVGVGSGTDALHLALRACGIGAGDEVIAPSHTAVATVAAIELAGAHPVLVDIDLWRYTLDPVGFAAAITERTRAVIPVHLYGCPADLAPILDIAHARGIIVLEDCAQAHGARYADRPVGSWGDLSAFSFYPTKNLGAYGDGGAIVTSDPELAGRLRLLRQYGWKERYVSSVRGFNTRLDDLQAAVLRVKLRYLDQWNRRRRELARLYDGLLAESGLVLPLEPENVRHVYHQYVVRHPKRDQLKSFLRERGIETSIHYPLPVHLQPAYQMLNTGNLTASENAAAEVLSLPIYPELGDQAIRTVCKAIQNFEHLRG